MMQFCSLTGFWGNGLNAFFSIFCTIAQGVRPLHLLGVPLNQI